MTEMFKVRQAVHNNGYKIEHPKKFKDLQRKNCLLTHSRFHENCLLFITGLFRARPRWTLVPPKGASLHDWSKSRPNAGSAALPVLVARGNGKKQCVGNARWETNRQTPVEGLQSPIFVRRNRRKHRCTVLISSRANFEFTSTVFCVLTVLAMLIQEWVDKRVWSMIWKGDFEHHFIKLIIYELNRINRTHTCIFIMNLFGQVCGFSENCLKLKLPKMHIKLIFKSTKKREVRSVSRNMLSQRFFVMNNRKRAIF